MQLTNIIPSCIVIILALVSCETENKGVYAVDLDKAIVKDSSYMEVKKYSLAFNEFRKKNDIPILPDSFVLNRYGLDFVGWDNQTDRLPVYHNKLIVWSVDSLIYERSLFLGPKKEIVIIWFGKSETNPEYHLSCSFRNADSVRSSDITKKVADSVIYSWALYRLYFDTIKEVTWKVNANGEFIESK